MNTWTSRSVLAAATPIVVPAGSSLVGCSNIRPTRLSGGGPYGAPGGHVRWHPAGDPHTITSD